MAQVKNVVLSIAGPTQNPDTHRNVTVDYTLSFEPSEIGQQFQVGVQLLGDDSTPDDEAAPLGQTPQPVIYTFRFGLLNPLAYTTVTAQAAQQNFTLTHSVPTTVLNEDPGVKVVQPLGLEIPHADEVVALVNVGSVGRSNRVSLFL